MAGVNSPERRESLRDAARRSRHQRVKRTPVRSLPRWWPVCVVLALGLAAPAAAQPDPAPAPDAPAEGPPPAPGEAPPEASGDSETLDGGVAADGGEAPASEPSEPVPEQPHGDVPVSVEELVGEDAGASEPLAKPEPTQPEPTQPEPAKPEPTKPVEPEAPPPGPMVVWETADWGQALGAVRCGPRGLEDTEAALRVASALKASTAVAGLGVATGGALADHPLLRHAAGQRPEELASLLAAAGFSALAVGPADLRGPLMDTPRLGEALAQEHVAVVASNLACAGQAYCEPWHTAEDPLTVIERRGRRYALISLLPDDVLMRVEPRTTPPLVVRPAFDALLARLDEAKARGVDLVIAHLDHGPDATAPVKLAEFVRGLPRELRPDLLLSPSSGEQLLFLRPLDVQPAIVGTRRDALTGVRVQRLEDRDADVLARTVRLPAPDSELAARLARLGDALCSARGAPLPGGRLEHAMDSAQLVGLGAVAARELASADVVLVDPRAYEPTAWFRAGEALHASQVERAVPFDAPLVVAKVSLDWLKSLALQLEGLRPLTLIGVEQDRGDTLIAGRLAVPGALYRIVTTSVLARSDRIPPGAEFEPLTTSGASLRGALLRLLHKASPRDPRAALADPLLGLQWIVRFDGQLLTNLTAIKARGRYEDPALQANDSRQVGGRIVLNADGDTASYLFENTLQVAFDRNFATRTTAQDLTFLQTTYTYRGLWPAPMFYPHPFAEGYLETSFLRPNDAEFHRMLLRPRAGVRSFFTRVLSLKVSAGVQVELLEDERKPKPGLGAELVLKPWSVVSPTGTLQLEGNVTYYFNSPGRDEDHWLRGQLISSYTMVGPLQATLSALGVLRKEPTVETGLGITMQVGLRVRFVRRAKWD
jgi:hypothetical protein